MSFLNVGDQAPDFALQNQNGDLVRLSDYKGKTVVVYFYPKAMTPGCTTQACGLRDANDAYAARDIVVLGLSPDTHERLKRFEDKYDLNFTLLSDEDHSVAEAYGAWGLKKFMGREFMGILRSTFVIDGNGVISHVMATVKTKTHHDDVLALIG
ncbi:Thiol peroxidase, Bcp-type [Aequoribacter fuscus]|uniref:thioredoxin-dependent peroxiredoxin n=1 Tax=Aequoribacter fuscus TaxID=2518989 RepID=F3L0Y3_9GAMM|nr:thioredoxin-dependent thiol peroxidase [Aequoribacter fuscus]EGG29928.1 Thiol peroxidase, Bcp-type [Aequoribacter fuscus]QHJ88077.1 thioredoxin-dependent thiol peroxidase [Aequoribacter fuscus]